MSQDLIAHLVTSTIEAIVGIAVLYVGYQILKVKEWFRTEMTKAVKENCAGKVEFDAHAKADDLFQNNLMQDIAEKRADYAKQHRDHYAHEGRTDIHQPSMSSDLLEAKFENVKTQVASVGTRVDHLAAIVEKRLA